MRALCWYGNNDVRAVTVSDPSILNPHDAIIRVRLSSVCGSDLHLYDGFVPSMMPGDIIGHEFMGEVVDTGRDVQNLQRGDRVVVCSIIACGKCLYCQRGLFSLCENSNPNAWAEGSLFGYHTAGIFGYSHLFGGYAGSHAEYIRVPFADVNAFKIPEGVADDAALFASDAFPTGFFAADNCNIQLGDIVAVWGCGAVGLMALCSAYLLGAERVIAIDRFPERLQMAREHVGAEILNYMEVDVIEALKDITAGRGPDACIDAVGMEAHAGGLPGMYDKVKQTLRLELDRPHVLRHAIQACRPGGTLSIVGVYAGLLDKIPMGAAMNKALTFKMGQQPGHRYIPRLLDYIAAGQVDPSFVITHRMSLDHGQEGYQLFKTKAEDCVRVVFTP
ncbi:MAG: glutathione-dependent formaldehyde dehydrogenase [Chloroflexi bacterium]|nr:glutathione-dependent formaldehyde dehydrogenase [Chloroflexota bacterium]